MYQFFSKYQCGFRRGYNTQYCLLAMLEAWKSAVDKWESFGALLTDLCKAFDCLSHELLLAKLYACKFSIAAISRHFSHANKSRIFKSLNFRGKADRSLSGNWLVNHLRHLKLHSNAQSWLARSPCHMGTFWKTKNWSSHFWKGQQFKFFCVEFTAAEGLNSPKQVFLLNLRLWPAHSQTFGLFSTWELLRKLIRKGCSVKPTGFWFKN